MAITPSKIKIFEKIQLSHRYKLGYLLSSPFFGFQTLILRLLLGGGQKFERLSLIRVEAAEAIMHLNGISGAYYNWR